MAKLYLGTELIVDLDKKLEKVSITQAEYNALTTKDDGVIYVITDADDRITEIEGKIEEANFNVNSLVNSSVQSVTTTGSGNAITAISKDGSTVTATKGSTFVTTNGTQTISGQKTITGTTVFTGNTFFDNTPTNNGYYLSTSTGTKFFVGWQEGHAWKKNMMSVTPDGDITAYGKFIKNGGTSSQFLKADGSVDSNKYLTSTDAITAKLYTYTLRKNSNSSTTGNYTKIGHIKFTQNWQSTSCLINVIDGENSAAGVLLLGGRTSNIVDTESGLALKWLSLTNQNDVECFCLVKTADREYDIYWHNTSVYRTLYFYIIGDLHKSIITSVTNENVDSITPTVRSSLGGIGNKAASLIDTSNYTAWGQTFFTNGVPKSISGTLTTDSIKIGSNTINSDSVTKWNNVAAIMDSDSDNVVNKWNEVVSFLATYTEADTLAKLLSNKADKTSLSNYVTKSDFEWSEYD